MGLDSLRNQAFSLIDETHTFIICNLSLLFHAFYRTLTPYFCVCGGTMPFMRKYSTS